MQMYGGAEVQLHAPTALPRRNNPNTHWLGGSHSQCARHSEEKNPALPGIKPQYSGSQPSHCTDWYNQAPFQMWWQKNTVAPMPKH